MYNTVTEMHIALDMALQQVNSNRQMSIPADFKDMALNYAVLQFIETRTNPKTNIKKEGLEATTKRYDDLKDLKRSHTSKAYKYADNKVASLLPSDYYKYIEFGCDVSYSKYKTFKTKDKRVNYYVLPFESVYGEREYYTEFQIKGDRDIIFQSSKYPNLPILYESDAKFMIINLVLEELNKIKGIEVYWEYYKDEYYKQSLIIVNTASSVIHQEYSISYDRINKTAEHKTEDLLVYIDINSTTERPVDITSSDITYSINSNHYYKTNRQYNPSGEILDNKVIVNEGDNFVIDNIKLTYYKKPRPISYRHEQMCEIEVTREIIDLAVQRLQSYLKDEGYQYTVNENQIIE